MCAFVYLTDHTKRNSFNENKSVLGGGSKWVQNNLHHQYLRSKLERIAHSMSQGPRLPLQSVKHCVRGIMILLSLPLSRGMIVIPPSQTLFANVPKNIIVQNNTAFGGFHEKGKRQDQSATSAYLDPKLFLSPGTVKVRDLWKCRKKISIRASCTPIRPADGHATINAKSRQVDHARNCSRTWGFARGPTSLVVCVLHGPTSRYHLKTLYIIEQKHFAS